MRRNVKNKFEEETVIFLYEKVEEFNQSELSEKEFCNRHNLSFSTFKNFKYILNFDKRINKLKEKYDHYLEEAKREGCSIRGIAAKYNLNKTEIGLYNIYLKYKKIIANYLNSKNTIEQPMSFVKVKAQEPIATHEMNHHPIQIQSKEPELMEKQNDLELIISKGIKVIVSPEIDSMKLIKIIELLRNI